MSRTAPDPKFDAIRLALELTHAEKLIGCAKHDPDLDRLAQHMRDPFAEQRRAVENGDPNRLFAVLRPMNGSALAESSSIRLVQGCILTHSIDHLERWRREIGHARFDSCGVGEPGTVHCTLVAQPM